MYLKRAQRNVLKMKNSILKTFLLYLLTVKNKVLISLSKER